MNSNKSENKSEEKKKKNPNSAHRDFSVCYTNLCASLLQFSTSQSQLKNLKCN